MPLKREHRQAFTLVELIVVLLIMGVVASLAVTRLSGMARTAVPLSPGTLRHYLAAIDSAQRLDLLCYDGCRRCDVYEGGNVARSGIALSAPGPVSVRTFDRFGRLLDADPAVLWTPAGGREGCFLLTLLPDGTLSPLILAVRGRLYAYGPLTNEDPVQASDEATLRRMIYDPATYPMSAEGYYGTR